MKIKHGLLIREGWSILFCFELCLFFEVSSLFFLCYDSLGTLQALVDKDPGLTGNLLVERLVGAHIDLVSKEEYAKVGSLVILLFLIFSEFCSIFGDCL